MAKALRYIHTQKIIHRDIKPENVHLNAGGRGEADGLRHRQDRRSAAMTRAGFVLGTPYYMAPEQVIGDTR